MTVAWDDLGTNHTTTGRELTNTLADGVWYASEANSGAFTTGKKYFEIVLTESDYNSFIVGVSASNISTYPGCNTTSWAIYTSTGQKYYNAAAAAYGSGYAEGQVVGVAVDIDAGKIWFSKNNVWPISGNPATGDNPAFTGLTGTIKPCVGIFYAESVTGNFKSADLVYSPPSGFDPLEADVSLRLVSLLEQNYVLSSATLIKTLDQNYSLYTALIATLSQLYGIKLLTILSQRYGDVPAFRRILEQYYGDAAILRRKVDQPYGDALALRQLVEQLWTLPADLRARLEQTYAISGEALRRLMAENYHINEYNQLRRQLEQIYLIAPGSAAVQQPSISVTAAGVELSPHHINIEIDENDFAIRGEIHLADQADYLLCLHLQTTLTVTIDSDTYTVLVEAPRQSRPEVGREEYIVPFASPAILLDSPYAATITRDFAGAMVSAIVAEMAGLAGVSVSYTCVDWYLPSTSLYANNETPLAIIRKLVAAVGGVLQSSPDGTLICRPEYPQTVPSWETAAPAYYLTDMDNYFSVDSSPALRQGYNRFLIADKNIGETGLPPEQREINATTKEILVYRVPWNDLVPIRLETSGGSWVSIIDEGVHTETLTEQVEIVAGVGRVAKPLYAKTAHDYKEANLGTVTAAEDGSLQTEIAANSLVDITYVTKFHLFRVSSPRLEDVQFYPV